MNVAVLTLVRDRLEYTQHCFATLRELAGCKYDHYVLDQGSDHRTRQWLYDTEPHYRKLVTLSQNVGIARGLNRLLDVAGGGYDVVIKIDNDCELHQPDTVRTIAELVVEDGNTLLSPRILGLNNPPAAQGTFTIRDQQVLDIPQIGGIFLAAPARAYSEYRYPQTAPAWGLDDADVCRWWRARGGRCGYVSTLDAYHYETTSGQHARYPEYFARTLAEGKPAL